MLRSSGDYLRAVPRLTTPPTTPTTAPPARPTGAPPPPDLTANDRPLSAPEAGKTGLRRRVVGYIRVSTEEQAQFGISLAAQEAKLHAYALAMDLELVGVERDEGVSAKSLERPGLRRALARLDAGDAGGLLVAKLDRLTRSVRDLATLLEEYFESRFELLAIADSIDTHTANGRMILFIMGSISQWEREVIGERTRDALAHKRAMGGGTPRLEGPAVDRIRELHASGLSLRAIARALEAEGFQTLKGGKWAMQTVRKVLERAA